MSKPLKVGVFIKHILNGNTYTFSREDFRGNVFGYSEGSAREQVLGQRDMYIALVAP